MKKQGKKTRIQYAPVRVIGGAKECVTLSELAGAGSNAIQWSPGALSVLDMRVYYADGSQGTLAAGDTLVRQGEGWLHALAGQPPRPVVGLWLQPPQASVTDVQAEVQRSLAAGKRAMVVELDGLSCAALQVAAEQGGWRAPCFPAFLPRGWPASSPEPPPMSPVWRRMACAVWRRACRICLNTQHAPACGRRWWRGIPS